MHPFRFFWIGFFLVRLIGKGTATAKATEVRPSNRLSTLINGLFWLSFLAWLLTLLY
ncbi:MAG: hypothetical protein RIG62_18275 [Cyclobacteriaceae bacterium]